MHFFPVMPELVVDRRKPARRRRQTPKRLAWIRARRSVD